MTSLVERKEELKKELEGTQNELEEWKKHYRFFQIIIIIKIIPW